PLATFISSVKTSLLHADFGELAAACTRILESVREQLGNDGTLEQEATDQFRPENVSYLLQWFPRRTLTEINAALSVIRNNPIPAARSLVTLALSDQLRE